MWSFVIIYQRRVIFGSRYFALKPHLKFLIHLIEPYIISKLMQSHKIKRVKVIKQENFPILGLPKYIQHRR
jgi:hypothetical protein